MVDFFEKMRKCQPVSHKTSWRNAVLPEAVKTMTLPSDEDASMLSRLLANHPGNEGVYFQEVTDTRLLWDTKVGDLYQIHPSGKKLKLKLICLLVHPACLRIFEYGFDVNTLSFVMAVCCK